jgi:putative flippase GtrA
VPRATAVRHAVSYLSVAALCFLLDVATVYAVRQGPGLPLVLAVLVGFAANVSAGFGLHRRLVFRPPRLRAVRARRRYALLVGINVAVGVLGVSWVVAVGVSYPLARVTASGFMVVVNYIAMRWWIFASTPQTTHGLS